LKVRRDQTGGAAAGAVWLWGAMGLLDDAIREHLDLKRRNGGDPGEIARKENEALAPVFPDAGRGAVEVEAPAEEDVGWEDDGMYAPESAVDPLAGEPDAAAPEAELAPPPAALEAETMAAEPAAPAEQARIDHVGQETAELDMQAVLDGQLQPVGDPEPTLSQASAAGPARASAAQDQEEDSFEWELPAANDEAAPPQEIPGQERLSFE
jgi:hypothetical protein